MDPLLSTLILILLALLGARFSFSTEQVPAGPRLLFRTGTHFLFIGWLLGPGGMELITADAVEQLYPLLAIGLGWVGLLFGMQLDREALGQFPPGYFIIALGQALVTYGLFVALGWLGLELLGIRHQVSTLILLAAAAAACVTAPGGIAMVAANFLARGNTLQILFFIASVDALVGIGALQILYSLYHPADVLAGLGPAPALVWLALALGVGVVSAIIFLWLTRPRPTQEELVLYLLGISALGSGAALQLQLSPLFVCVVMGMTVANLAPDHHRVFQALQKWEKPVYVILLLLGGALLTVSTWWVVPLAVGYVVVRALGKWLAGALLVPVTPLPFDVPRNVGLGLIPQGGISLAMAVSVVLTYSGLLLPGGLSAVEVLFDIVVLGVVASELVGPLLTTWVLRGAGEISPGVEDALQEGDTDRARTRALRDTTGAPPPSDAVEGEPR